jgi:glycerate 2-kinase
MSPRAARRLLARLYRSSLRGVDPRRGVARALAQPAVARGLDRADRLGVFAVGKAAAGMLAGAAGWFERGLAVLPRGYPIPRVAGVEVIQSAHPVPDRASEAAARAAIALFESFGADDAILCLVSGGSSALLELPRAGVTLAVLSREVASRVAGGASIEEVNRVRTALSAVKGGRLGRRTRARLVSLLLSDVPGDRPEVIGSGPTIRRRRGDVVRVVGSNRGGLEVAATDARRAGVVPRLRRARLAGEADRAGADFGLAAARLAPGEILLAGGETTVTLKPRPGKGGRSLELALGAARAIAGRPVVLLAAGSDGRDGSSDAAGAFADGETLSRAGRLGLDPDAALRRHDTDPFFEALGDLFRTGPTGGNVADWAFGLRL